MTLNLNLNEIIINMSRSVNIKVVIEISEVYVNIIKIRLVELDIKCISILHTMIQ